MKKKHKILVVDDEEGILQALTRTLRSEGEVLTAKGGEEALEILKKHDSQIKVIISDQKMPKMTGLELLKEVARTHPHIIRIILTGFTDIEDLIAAINVANLYRYITKPWNNNELRLTIRRALELFDLEEKSKKLFNDLQKQNKSLANKEKELRRVNVNLEKTVDRRTKEIRKANEKLQKLSLTDNLTEVGNHRSFIESFQTELSRAKRYKYPFSLLMIDVDYFKHYNDINGHPKGDQVLKKIAKILKKNVRDVDTVARYGGEEFVIILPMTSKVDAGDLAERLRKTIEEKKFPNQRKQPNKTLTVSIGVASFPENGETIESILFSADQALYKAKKKGRNKVVVSDNK